MQKHNVTEVSRIKESGSLSERSSKQPSSAAMCFSPFKASSTVPKGVEISKNPVMRSEEQTSPSLKPELKKSQGVTNEIEGLPLLEFDCFSFEGEP